MSITAGSNIVASDFVGSSSGAGDSGKVPKLNASGRIPAGFVGQFSTTQVFSGTAPNGTFTDLDLSSVTGAKQVMALLKITQTDGSTRNFSFRPNGDTSDYLTNNTAVNNIALPQNKYGTVLVKTDTAGVVEWTCNGAAPTATITVEAYW